MLFKNPVFFFVPALLGWSAYSIAETQQPTGPLEEVVVSALRKESVREMDGSISALNREEIRSSSVQHFQELVQQVPNLNLSGEGSRARYFQLRGIGELEQYEGAPNPSVGFIVDDIDLSGVGGISNLFDVERVEVQRGPQATRFGANAIAGLIYVQSAETVEDTAFHAELTVGNDSTRAGGVSLGGALGDGLNGRISMHRYASDGFYDNVSLGRDDTNQRDELVGRAKLDWHLDGGWAARLSLLFADFDNGYDAWSPENGRTTYSDHPGRDEQRTAGASLRFDGPLNDAADFVSITGYAGSDILFSYDGEWGDAGYWAPYVYDYGYVNTRDRTTLSQEFRVVSSPAGRIFDGTTDWLVGLYAQRLEESNHILSQGIYDDSADAPFSYCAPCLDRSTLESDYRSLNYALFGKLDRPLGDRLSLSAGLRLERWQADYDDLFRDEIWGDPDQPARNAFSPEETLWGGEISLDYELEGDASLYALVSRGYKAGGFNPSFARAVGAGAGNGSGSVGFDPEALWNYEAGIRGRWLEGRVSGDLSVFYMDREDMQLRSSAQYTDNPNDFIFITSNAAGHSMGLEASLEWSVTERWSLQGRLGLLESSVDEYHLLREADIEGSVVGRDFAHAPPYTAHLGLVYRSAEEHGWLARLDIGAAGAYYFDYSHDEKAPSRTTVNLKVGRRWGRWEATAWVRNLFDERYFERGFSFGLEPPWFARTRYTRLGDPRHYGLTVNYRY